MSRLSAMKILSRTLSRFVPSTLLACAIWLASGWAQAGPNLKHKVNLPPSADLSYSIRAKQSGMRIDGDGLVHWTAANRRFEVISETRAGLLGKILETRSEGGIDEYGLAPSRFTEKRFRKRAVTTSFDRASNTIAFGNSSQSYRLQGGEQDRNSALWQLIAVARGAPGQFKTGSEWSFVVAGHADAEPWIFKVLKQDKIRTPMGELNAVHISRAPPPDSKDQKLDIWLAPSLEWYPVRLRFTEADGDYIEQTLREARKKSS